MMGDGVGVGVYMGDDGCVIGRFGVVVVGVVVGVIVGVIAGAVV